MYNDSSKRLTEIETFRLLLFRHKNKEKSAT